jgi:hypothetical protein
MKHDLNIWFAGLLGRESIDDVGIEQALNLVESNGCEYSLNLVDGLNTANIYRKDSLDSEFAQDADRTIAVLTALKKVLEKK